MKQLAPPFIYIKDVHSNSMVSLTGKIRKNNVEELL